MKRLSSHVREGMEAGFGCIASAVRNRREMNAGACWAFSWALSLPSSLFSLSHRAWSVSTLVREGPLSSVQLLSKCILRHAQKHVFLEILNPVKRAMSTDQFVYVSLGRESTLREERVSLKETVLSHYPIQWMDSVHNSERII